MRWAGPCRGPYIHFGQEAALTEHLPPGPRGHWLRGNLPRYEADRLGFLRRCQEEYGDFCSFDGNTVVVGDPVAVHEILGKTNAEYLAEGTLFAGGDDLDEAAERAAVWMAARRKGSRGFNRRVATAHAERMIGMLDEQLGRAGARTVDVQPLMARVSGCMVADYCFGGEGSALVETIEAQVAAAIPIMSAARVLPRWMPAARNRRFAAARRRTMAAIGGIVDRRRALPAPEPPRDLLDVLLAARDPELTQHQIEEVLRVTLLASYGVPGTTLAWIVRELSFRPDIQARVQDEATAWDGRDTPPELATLPYTEALVKEILRAYTPTWLMGRTVREEVRVGPWTLAPGRQIMFCPYLIHRDPRWWDEPEKIDPGRWLGEKAPHARHAYFPFGAGPRTCLGTHLGMLQLTLVTSWLARRYSIAVETPGTVPASPAALLSPAGLRASFAVREHEEAGFVSAGGR